MKLSVMWMAVPLGAAISAILLPHDIGTAEALTSHSPVKTKSSMSHTRIPTGTIESLISPAPGNLTAQDRPDTDGVNLVDLEAWAIARIHCDPVQTLQRLDGKLPPGIEAERVMERVLAEWSSRRPSEAAVWLASYEKSSEILWLPVMAAWVKTGVEEPGNWLNTLDPGTAYDEAARAFCLEVARTSPTESVAWAATISNEMIRTQALGQGLRRWFLQDSPAASSYAKFQGLPLHLLGIPD